MAHRPHALHGCVFRARDVLADGVLTRDALRSSAWRRLFRGVYADARLPDSFALRVRGARLLIPSAGVFSGRTAAYLLGAPALVDSATQVEVSVPAGMQFGPVTGLRIRRLPLPEADLTQVGGFRCTRGLRTALDIARAEPVVEAVVALDVLLARVVVGKGELEVAGRRLVGGRGARSARLAIGLADQRSESPQESRLRVLLALAGLHPVPQFVVRDPDGVFVARVDLAFPAHRIAVEYDGLWHAEDGQFAQDRRRLNRLAACGWIVLHVTAADLHHPAALVTRLGALLRSRESGEMGASTGISGPTSPHSAPGSVHDRGAQPRSRVHQGPPEPSATPTPSDVRLQSRMFAR
jgi:very-short-patch-repair endonuclease